MLKRFKITIKEKGKAHILTTTFEGNNISQSFLIQFYGLDNEDVEWYRIEEETSQI